MLQLSANLDTTGFGRTLHQRATQLSALLNWDGRMRKFLYVMGVHSNRTQHVYLSPNLYTETTERGIVQVAPRIQDFVLDSAQTFMFPGDFGITIERIGNPREDNNWIGLRRSFFNEHPETASSIVLLTALAVNDFITGM